jgi:Kef-type K+ transport system membrane component KefB
MGRLNETSSIIMLGVLVVEDLAVVLLLAVIQSAVSIGTISVEAMLTLGAKIVPFLGGSLFLGWKAVAPFMARVSLPLQEARAPLRIP